MAKIKAIDLLREVCEKFEVESISDHSGTIPTALVNKIRKALKIEIPKEKPIPAELEKALKNYAFELHPKIIKELKKGNLEFCSCNKEGKKLSFWIPKLAERKTTAMFYWHGPDHKTWDMGSIRLWAENDYEDGDSQELWSPEHGHKEDGSGTGRPHTAEEHEQNVEDFIYWLHTEVE